MFVVKLSQNEVFECHGVLDSALEEINFTFLFNKIVIFSFPKLWIKPKEDKVQAIHFYRKILSNLNKDKK